MYKSISFSLLMVATVAGCSNRTAKPTADAVLTAVGAKYLTENEPVGAKPVAEVLGADDQADVTVVGRIGGSENPWVDNMAAFTIVDPSLKACSDIPGDTCEKPWDYCCESPQTMKSHSVAVKFADETGAVVATDARKLFGVEPLQTVIIRGKLHKDESGKTAVLAEKMYVRK